jgi:hypothetical protein
MRIRQIVLDNFGPFRSYRLTFTQEDPACILLTGRNNEGKSSILLALKLVNSALRNIGRVRHPVVTDTGVFYRLPHQDVQDMNIGRMLHNYQGTQARIEVVLSDGFEANVILDPDRNAIYTDCDRKVIPSDSQGILGFIPPLGPLAENEEFLTEKHVRASIETSLAPRHLRNHLYRILRAQEYEMVQAIVRESWPSIELLDCEHQTDDNTLRCFYTEAGFTREIAWAGQGLQVWFQIVTHLVRLRSTSILVLDEPEVNLHPEKQNDLIRILTDYHAGSSIIATHSVELMNNVNVSHIIHVQKQDRRPTLKSTADRVGLDLVRSRIGSNFNLIASQFEDCDLILYTENAFDYSVIIAIAEALGIKKRSFNIPIHGQSEYPKAAAYKDAYRLLIGRPTPHTMLLDRDYYPEAHLSLIRDSCEASGIRTLFTPGKEIENLFLEPAAIDALLPAGSREEFCSYWNHVFKQAELDCFGSYQTLHEQFIKPKIDSKTVVRRFKPVFDKCWNDPDRRHLIIAGKDALKRLRAFYRSKTAQNLTLKALIGAAVKTDTGHLRSHIEQIYHLRPVQTQTLHY